MSNEKLKRQAAFAAVEFIESGMIVGLGVGSTTIHAVEKIGELIRNGKLSNIKGIPCSNDVEKIATSIGIPITTLNDNPIIDLTIDGADEVDSEMNLIKGGGGALLKEKIVAQASIREIIVVDSSKLSNRLGTQWAVPIEVIPFGWKAQFEYLLSIGGDPILRLVDNITPYVTDERNFIIDCDFGVIDDIETLSKILDMRVGIVEHGIFSNLATDLIIASVSGIQHIERK